MPFTQLPGVVGQFQALQENQLMMEGQKADLQSLALKQEDAQLTLQQKKLDLANQEAFRQTVLAKMSAGDQADSQLRAAAGEPTPYQNFHNQMGNVQDKLQSHVSLVQATQDAIKEYAHKDPLYAQKMQEQLNKQIKEGFDLNKEHFELQSKETAKVSDELYPVLNSPTTGGFDKDMYKLWYDERKAEGVPLADMGLTGDPAMDEKQLRLIYSHGVAAKDQIQAHYRDVQEAEKQWKEDMARKSYDERVRHDLATEGNARDRIARGGRAPSKVADPGALYDKAQVAEHDKYQIQYDKLASKFNKEADPDKKKAIYKEIEMLNDNFEKKKELIARGYGLSAKTTKPAASVEDDLISQYSPR